MTGIGTGLKLLSLPKQIAIGLVVLAILVAAVLVWGNSKYRAGHKAGVTETDALWEAASAKLKEAAAQSASKADDKAAARLDEFKAQADEDAAAVEKAKAEGTSPLDALFGG